MKLLKSKRGISPLIATILLVVIAISLGAFVMNYGKNIEQGIYVIDECRDFDKLQFDLAGRSTVCFTQNKKISEPETASIGRVSLEKDRFQEVYNLNPK